MFPNAQRLNRGNYVMGQLVQACRANNVTDLIIIHEHRGEPGMAEVGRSSGQSQDKLGDIAKFKIPAHLILVLVLACIMCEQT